MTPERAERVLLEASRLRKRQNLIGEAYPRQRAFLESTCRTRVACCTRRAGKSYGLGLLLYQRALSRPNVTAIFIALTRESAKRIMWRDVLQEIDRKYSIGAKFNESDLTVTLPNGSVIALVGGDASLAEAAKLKGIKPILAVVDECQDFRTDLERLVVSVLRPALVDNEGDLLLCGVPGNIKSFFYRVSTGLEPGWEVHQWSALDNPSVAQKWQKEIDALIAINPRVVDAPWFLQEYRGAWVTDSNLLVYSSYSPVRNDTTDQPNIDDWVFLLGVDFGWNDATALVLAAYSHYDPTLYVLKAAKRTKQDVTAVAKWIGDWAERFPIAIYVADTASKQVVEELKARHGIPFQGAEKRGKSEAMMMMNSDLLMGKIKILQPHCAALTKEMQGLIWDSKKLPVKVEHPGCEQHLLDSLLYVWRCATNYNPLEKPSVRMGMPTTDAEMDAYADEREARISRKEWWDQ